MIVDSRELSEESRVISENRQKSQQLQEFLDGDFQILDDGAERLAFQFAAVHRNHDSRLVVWPNINSVAATLPTEFKTQILGYAD